MSQKAAEVLNFCLIGKIFHNFPMPMSIEPAPKTFVCIQMLLWRRVSREGPNTWRGHFPMSPYVVAILPYRITYTLR